MTKPDTRPPAAPTNGAAVSAVIVMGVAGSGKTYVGREVAKRMGWSFVDADDLHPRSNVEKMRAGVALTDADRKPWLEALNRLLLTKQRDGIDVALACSALKQRYRTALADGVPNLRIVHLDVPRTVILERVSARHGHFMPSELVSSQFADLEMPGPDEAIIIDADQAKEAVVDSVINALRGWIDVPN